MTPVDAGVGHCKTWRVLSAIERIASLASRASASPSKEGVGSSPMASRSGAGASAMILTAHLEKPNATYTRVVCFLLLSLSKP